MLVATAGHVDHGKTSLVKHLTGTDTDSLAEEKKRGLTINLGFAYRHFNDHCIGFVDVPGHIDFINNMLAGVAAVDFALLVVSADDGVMPQTKEHLEILNLLGIKQGAIALTKMDLVAPERLNEVKTELQSLLQGGLLEDCPIFPVSNEDGRGIEALANYLEARAVNQDNDKRVNDEEDDQPCRFSIDRAFVVKGIGTVVTGTLVNGQLKIGHKLHHSGSDEPVRIKGLRIDNDDVEIAKSGQRVAISINLSHNAIHRGDWLFTENALESTKDSDAVLTLTGTDQRFLQRNAYLHLYHHASHSLAQIRKLTFDSEESGGDANIIWVQIKTKEPLWCVYGDRFVVRDAAGKRTIAGGYFVDKFPPARKRHTTERQHYLQAINQMTPVAFASSLRQQKRGFNAEQFFRSRFLSDSQWRSLVNDGLISDDQLREYLNCSNQSDTKRHLILGELGSVDAHVIGVEYFVKQAQQIVCSVLDIQKATPDRQGIAALDLKRESQFPLDYVYFQLVLTKLIDLKQLMRSGTLIHSPDHRAQDRPEDLAFLRRLKPLLLKDELTPPRTRELCDLLDISLAKLDIHCHRLSQAGKLAQVAANRYYLPRTLVTLAEFSEQLAAKAEDKMFTVIEFRDATQVGRNLCIQILEYFDRQGFTARRGNKRLIRKPKESIFSTLVE